MTGSTHSFPVPIENGLMLLLLGLCPAIAVSARVIDAIWMSAGVMLVLVLSGLAMALLSAEGGAEQTPGRMPALAVAAFLTAAFEAGLLAFAPTASAGLGIYAPLIAVNCLVLGGRPPGSPPKTVVGSLREAVGRGARFAAALVLIALVRESLGAGTITLFSVGDFKGIVQIPGLVEQPVRALGLAGGGLLCLGYLAGAARAISRRAAARSSSAGATP